RTLFSEPMHIVCVLDDGSEPRIYINGEEASYRSRTAPSGTRTEADTNNTVRWMRDRYGAYSPKDIRFAEAAIYDYALSPERIAAHYAAASAEPSTSALLSIRQRYGR